jgi:transmembrane sensor
MDNEALKLLIDKYLEGKATEEESALLETWYVNYKTADHPEVNEAFITESVDRIWSRLDDQGTKKIKLWPRFIGAAAAITIILMSIYFFKTPHHPEGLIAENTLHQNKQEHNLATLTLADGTAIPLNNDKDGVIIGEVLRYTDGTNIKTSSHDKKHNPQTSQRSNLMLSASTPRGGQYQITLPDGTKVWLNAESKISFPSLFTGKQRKVILIGEAYFEVAKDKIRPFMVETKYQNVEVLGTHFNIKAYDNEPSINTTLLEGAVQIHHHNKLKILKPGQLAKVNSTDAIIIDNVITDDILAWKNGFIDFNESNIQTIMREIARWYDVEIIYQGSIPDRSFSGKIARNTKLSSVLEILKKSKINFKITEKTITVMP